MMGMMNMMNSYIAKTPTKEERKVGNIMEHAAIAESEVKALKSMKGMVSGMIDRTQFLDESSQMAIKEFQSLYDMHTEGLAQFVQRIQGMAASMGAGGMASMPSGMSGQSSGYNFNIASGDLEKMKGMMNMMNSYIAKTPTKEERKVGSMVDHAKIAESEVKALKSMKGMVAGMLERTQFLDENSQMAIKEFQSLYDMHTEGLF